MKIALVHPSMKVTGGAERVVACLCEELRNKGHQVDVFTLNFNPLVWPDEAFKKEEIRVLKSGRVNSITGSNTVTSFFVGPELRRLLRGYDIVNAHNYPSVHWVYSALRKMSSRPAVLWYCQEPSRKIHWHVTEAHLVDYVKRNWNSNDYSRYFQREYEYLTEREIRKKKKCYRERERDRKAIEHVDRILTNSNYTRSNLVKIHPHAANKTHICYLGVDQDWNENAGKYGKENYIVAIAPFVIYKNPITMIEAMRILVKKKKMDIQMKLVGKGKDSEFIHGLIDQYELSPYIEVMNQLSDEALNGMMKKAAFVLYLPICEPFGLVPLEAMGVGTPVIVSNHGGPAETVTDGVTGLHADPFSPEAVAGKCQYLLENREEREKMGKEGREYVRQYFSKEQFVERFEHHLGSMTTS